MAKQKPSSEGPKITGRYFSDKELREKAGRWAAQMARAASGKALKTDTIPETLEEALILGAALFSLDDNAVFNPALEEAVQ